MPQTVVRMTFLWTNEDDWYASSPPNQYKIMLKLLLIHRFQFNIFYNLKTQCSVRLCLVSVISR